MPEHAVVLGAGLAGCEAAWQLARRGVPVTLREMKPGEKSPAHTLASFAELVCSNSLRSDQLHNAAGLLKAEMRLLGSLVMEAADATRVPAGSALAVDRKRFSQYITQRIEAEPNITVMHGRAEKLPEAPAVVATGPLTDGPLLKAIEARVGEGLHFFDAAAPIVYQESLDLTKLFRASRYGKGSDYLNCPMTREEYFLFYQQLVSAETVQLKPFETANLFEGCMPVEAMARRGEMTLAFGPLKPVGLTAPDGSRPFAVVQLRQDDREGRLYNLVGFQTNLKQAEQRRVFGLIPGLARAEYARYGAMHRNTYLRAPGKLAWDYSLKDDPYFYFAGQITGVEGYLESAASGLTAGLSLARRLAGQAPVDFTPRTAIGALGHYVAGYPGKNFQPMNVNYGIVQGLEERVRNKQERYGRVAQRALDCVAQLMRANKL